MSKEVIDAVAKEAGDVIEVLSIHDLDRIEIRIAMKIKTKDGKILEQPGTTFTFATAKRATMAYQDARNILIEHQRKRAQ